MVAFVEADNKEKLLSFYENYGFQRFDTDRPQAQKNSMSWYSFETDLN